MENKEAYTSEEVVRIVNMLNSLQGDMAAIRNYKNHPSMKREDRNKAVKANQGYLRDTYVEIPENVRMSVKGLDEKVQKLLEIEPVTHGY